jgi:hypothetical protein
VRDSGLRQSHSFTVNMLRVLTAFIGVSTDIPDIYGTSLPQNPPAYTLPGGTTIPGTRGVFMHDVMCLNGDLGEELIGIVVGSGDFPETSLDEDMEARIRAEILTPSYHHFTDEDNAEAHRIILSRVFSNVTGDVVEVNEIGTPPHTRTCGTK